MAVRQFNNGHTTDYLSGTVPAALSTTGAFTWVFVHKRDDATNWSCLLNQRTSTPGDALTIEITSSGASTANAQRAEITDGAGGTAAVDYSTWTAATGDGWVITVLSKGGGNVIPVQSVFKGGSWTHMTTGNAFGDCRATTGGTLTIGVYQGSSDWLTGRLAAAAVWVGTALNTTQIASLSSGSISAWSAIASGPTEHWEFNQAAWATSVTGQKGVLNLAASGSGAIVTGDDPASGVYTLATSGGATVTAVPATALGSAPAASVTPITTVTAVPAAATGDSPGPVTTASAGTDTLGYANGPLGTPWLPWASLTRPTITSGKAYWTSGSFNDVSYPVSIGPDCLVEAILERALEGSAKSYGLGVRLTAHSNAADGYMFEVRDSAGGTDVFLFKGAAFTQIGTTTGFTSSTVDGLRLVAVGTAIQGYLRISGVWTLAVSATDATYTSGGYPGFWIIETAATLGIDQVSWGPATAGTDATVTAVPAVATGAAPVATATLTANATVTALAATATGDTPAAVVTGSGNATVTAVVALALGSAPPANSILSAVISAPAVVSLGSAPIATISSAGNATVTAVPALALGSSPVPALFAGQTIAAAVALALGSAPASTFAAGWTVTAVPAVAVGQAPRPTISPAPTGAGSGGQVAVTFAERSS